MFLSMSHLTHRTPLQPCYVNTWMDFYSLWKGTHKSPGFGQGKIMKEFVWINRFFFLTLAFGQVGEKNEGKECELCP